MSNCELKPSQTLRAARALIEDPENWITEFYGLDGEGNSLEPEDLNDAVCFCSLGAITRAYGDEFDSSIDYPKYTRASRYLRTVMEIEVGIFNDSHTHAEVLTKFDEAIAMAESEGK